MKQIRSNKGFTLVEIMIVVVIIGLLAAMAIPAFQKVRRNAFNKAMVNDARQIAAAGQQYLLENPGNTTVPIEYTTDTGVVSGELKQYVSKLARGYNITGPYDGTVNQTENAFTMAHPQVNGGAAVGFDTEGHLLAPLTLP
jgi:prepilin-type N-terminal cleavage/methylation domain-containing protein